MKKIKGLLLFGILTLLGIGSSFSQFYDLRDNTGSQLLIPSITHISTVPRSRFTFTLGNSDYYSSGYTDYNHELTNIYACYDSSYNVIGFRDTWGLMTFGDISNCSSSANRSLITPSSGTNGIRIFNYLYMRSNTSISPYSERKDSSILRYLYFDFNKYYTYSGYVQDVPDGYFRSNLFLSVAGNYGVVSQSLTDGSFLFTSLFDDSFLISNHSIYSGFILLHFGGYDSEYYNGGGTLLLSVLNESIIFNYYTGFYLNYSDISQVSPSLKGYITYNNSISEGYSKFFQMLTGKNNVILTNGSVPSNQLVFTAYGYTYYKQTNLGGGLFTKTTSYTFNFEIDESVPTFITPSSNGNQPILNRPSYTTGQVAACRNPSYYGVSALGEGFSNPICDEINSLIYVGEDENGNSIYVYYNDDGSWWVRTMGESNLTSVSAPAGFEIDSSGTVSTIWEVVCTGNFCDDYLSGLKAEDMEKYRYVNIEFGDAVILNTGYYENFFSSLNLTGYVFKCPYTYSNSRFVLGKNLIKKLGGYDPFLPVNCFVASFENGRRVHFFDDAFGDFNRGPLMDGDTQNHYNLFGFFDILLSIGLIFFLMKFYHLFK